MAEDIYEEIVQLRRQGLRAALATVVRRKGSTPREEAAKMLVYEDGRRTGSIGGGCTEAEVCREAQTAIRRGKPALLKFDLTGDDAEDGGMICGGSMEVYVEPILPDPTLVIFGAGHVGRCVAEIAKTIGFRIVVVDDRIKYASRERFPFADALYVDGWEQVFQQLPVSESSYLLIVTRGHQHDLACLRFALQTQAGYIGLMGSTRKVKLFFEALEKEGVHPEQFKRVCSPVGIDIGSETPEEIAVSIAAQLIAVRKKKPGRAEHEP
ncbi:MAG: XdhC/CoxI family protein [Acidobacteriota bacterium]|jgi:xanthine dehydrogenase accessory factor